MKMITTVLVLFTILFSIPQTTLQAQDQRIPITLDRNRIVLPVRIDDSPTLKIIIDTGMQFDGLLLYDDSMAQFLDPEKRMNVQIPGAGGGKPSQAIMSDSASFICGGTVFTGQRILILQNDRFKGMRSDGIMGYSLLGHYMVEVNYDDLMITLHAFNQYQPDSTWRPVPLYFKSNQIPWIDAVINVTGEQDIEASLYIDSAARETLEILTYDGMKFKLPDSLEEVHLGTGLSGEIYGKMGSVHSFTIGPFTLRNIRAAFTDRAVRSKQKDADAVIGGAALRHFNLIFDYEGKMLYFKPNNGAQQREPNG